MNLVFRFISSVCIGILCSLYSLQFNKQCINFLDHFFQDTFEKNFECKASYQLDKVDPLTLRVHASNIFVHSLDKSSWYWKSKKIFVNNYWPWLLRKKLGLEILLKDMEAFSSIQNNYPLIADHLQKMILDTQNIPVTMKSLTLENVVFKARALDQPFHFSINMYGNAACTPNAMKMKLTVQEGIFFLKENLLLQEINGFFCMQKGEGNNAPWAIDGEGSCTSVLGGLLEKYFFYLHAHNKEMNMRVQHKNNDLNLNAWWNVQEDILKGEGTGNLRNFSFLWHTFQQNFIEGRFNVAGHYNLKNKVGDVVFDASNIRIGDLFLDKIRSVFTLHHNSFYGQGCINNDSRDVWSFKVQGNKSGTIEISGRNTDKLVLTNNLFIPSKKSLLKICIKNYQFVDANMHCTFNLDNKEYDVQVHMQYDDKLGLFNITGSCLDYSFTCTMQAKDFTITDLQAFWMSKQIVHLKKNENNKLTGLVDFSIFKQLVQHFLHIELRGGVPICVVLEQKKHKTQLSLSFKDAHLQIPGTYNFIQDFSAGLILDVAKRRLKIKNFVCNLHKGIMYSKKSIIRIGDTWDMHIPIIAEDIFFNKTQEARGFVSGTLLIKGSFFRPVCSGTLFLDQGSCKYVDIQSWLKGSIGVSFLRAGNINMPITLQLILKTQAPLHIDIPFMQSHCVADIHVDSSQHDLTVSGVVNILDGTLHFPYRSLYITHGKVIFMPQHINDPLIELVARGRIKKYQVIMRITGSVQHPDIHLESIPSLQDEQIITLLLSGSDKGSFAFAMPSVLLHNAHKWVLPKKSTQSSSKFEQYVRGFLEPFRHIRIIPSFIDQTSRGGFRGAIEITVSERLRAVIQKNFSLTEDTKLEVEYALSDDITLRAIRDERGDLGGEVEMRWKF